MSRLEHFLQVLTILPCRTEVPTEMLIMSTGEECGNWSFRHLSLPGRTNYFIFKKCGVKAGSGREWQCVEPELDEVMESGRLSPVGVSPYHK
jgi:hypothetical protein